MRQKRAEEESLRKAVAAKPDLREKYGTAWDEVAGSLRTPQGVPPRAEPVRVRRGVQHVALRDRPDPRPDGGRRHRPNAERLDSYDRRPRESLEQGLYSEAPIYPDLEIAKLADSLAMLVEHLGPDHPLVAKVLARPVPARAGRRLDPRVAAHRRRRARKIAKAGPEGDRVVGRPAHRARPPRRSAGPRAAEARHEEEVEELPRQADAKVAAARFAVLGSGTYPDATFTLRLAFGPVKGYEEAGNQIPPWTQLGGTYAHRGSPRQRRAVPAPKLLGSKAATS